jgi:MFS family permease
MNDTEYNAAIEKNYKWNFIWMTIDNSMFFFIFMGLSPYTILPLYVNHFSASSVMVGLIPTIYLVGTTLPQLFMANFLRKTKLRKKYLVLAASIQRFGILGLLLLSIFQPRLGLSPSITLTLFFLMFGVQHFASGFYVPVWIDFVGKSIPRKRGVMFGISNFIGGLMGLGIGWLLSYLLSRYQIDQAIPIIFAMSFTASLVSLMAILLWREVIPPDSFFTYKGNRNNSFGDVLTDKNFVNFLVWRGLMVILEIATPFYSISALRLPDVGPAQVGIFTTILSFFQAVVNPFWGWFGDRNGFFNVVKLSCLAGIIAALLGVINPSLFSYYLIYVFLGLMLSGFSISAFNIIYDFSPKQLVYLYLALSQISLTPLSSVIPLLGGVIADQFGFMANYWIAAGMGTVSLVGMMLKVKDPRKNKEAHLDKLASENLT